IWQGLGIYPDWRSERQANAQSGITDQSIPCINRRNALNIADFSEIEAEFIQRVHTMVWCNVATVDSRNRPRSRVLHPIWEGSTGWITTHRSSHKARH